MSGEAQTTIAKDGWGYDWSISICPNCHSSFLSGDQAGNRVCPVCFGAALATQEAYPVLANPELILPFGFDQARLQAILAAWAHGPWLKAPDMNEQALAGRVTRLFIPMWLVDGQVSGMWQAQAGYEYQVASSRDAYSGGQWTSSQVNETRLRWEPRLGTIQRQYQNLAVPALEEHSRLAAQTGRFPIQSAGGYQASLAKDALVLLPNIPIENAFPLAKTQFDRAAGVDCQAAAGAQRVEQISLRCDYQQLNWTLLLMPVFTSFYRDESGTVRPVVINGVTGEVSGVKRASQSKGWKWTGALAAVGLACILAAVLIGLLAALLPPAVVISGLLFIVGAGLVLASPIPAIWAWQFNRHSE